MKTKTKVVTLVAVLALLLAVVCCAGCVTNTPQDQQTATPTVAPTASFQTPLDKLYEEHVINLDSVQNVRDMGGYPAADGKTIKKGLLIRSGNLAKLSDEDKKTLEDIYHLKHIYDFRSELQHTSSPDKEVNGAEYHWIKVNEDSSIDTSDLSHAGEFQINNGELNAEKVAEYPFSKRIKTALRYDEKYAAEGGINGMTKAYITNEDSQKGFSEFLKSVVDNAGDAVLWHCAAGKDRAGVATVLILSALGVDKETILDDYQLTNIYNRDLLNALRTELQQYDPSEETITRVLEVAGVTRKNMEEVFDLIDSKYGGMDAYLHNQMGLTDEDLQKLRAAYLE